MKRIHAVLFLCVAAALAGCGGGSSDDPVTPNDPVTPKSATLHLQVDGASTKYSSGAEIDLGTFTSSEYSFATKEHTFALINDDDSGAAVALGGIELVSGSIGDGTTTRITFGEWYGNLLGYFDLPDVSALTDATFAHGESASFDVNFVNGYFEDGDYRAADGTWNYSLTHPLWHPRYKYRIKVTDDKGAADDFLFEVYGVASC